MLFVREIQQWTVYLRRFSKICYTHTKNATYFLKKSSIAEFYFIIFFLWSYEQENKLTDGKKVAPSLIWNFFKNEVRIVLSLLSDSRHHDDGEPFQIRSHHTASEAGRWLYENKQNLETHSISY